MKFFSRRLLLLMLFAGYAFTGRASHIFGADFYYEALSDSVYKVTMEVYGDCSGSSFPSLPSSTPQVQLMNYTTVVSTQFLYLEGPGVEVTPVCPSELNNTNCKGGTVPGVTRYIYSNTFVVPGKSANWKFHFTGSMGTATQAGRSNAITNLIIPGNGSGGTGGSIMVLDVTLNNVDGRNSSPRFTTLPTPFYCVNVAQQYNQGAVDPNGDSLVYALAPAQQATGTVAYQAGFSAADPMGLGPSNFSFNTQTGQMNFTPTSVQYLDFVNKVYEYRNGQLVGSATREMTFVIRANCTNNAPRGLADTAASTYSGGVPDLATNTFTACENAGVISFHIKASDADNNNVIISAAGLPSGASFVATNNGTLSPTGIFSWNITGVPAGTYTIYLTYKDDGCPLSSQQTQAFLIRIVKPATITPQLLSATGCINKARVRITLTNGALPRTVIIRRNGNVVKTFVDSTGVYMDSLAAGTYQISVAATTSPCSSEAIFTVPDSGAFPYPPIPVDAYYCKGAAPVSLTANAYAGASLYWYDTLGARLPAPPVPNTAVTGIYTWYVSNYYNVCESSKVPVKVYVTERPVAAMLVTPTELCTKDTATITFTGTIGTGPILDYYWNWNGGFASTGSGPGPWKVQWSDPGVKTITLQVAENKCASDTVSRTITVKPTPVADFTANSICLYDSMNVVYVVPDSLPGQAYTWQFDQAFQSHASGPFHIKWDVAGTKHIFLEVSLNGCSDTTSRNPMVYEVPDAVITTQPSTVCLGDKIYLEYTGTGTAIWTPKLRVYSETDGRIYTNVIAPTTYTLRLTNDYGCVDSSSVTFTDIQPCCNFSYPNAFTPNNDGRNDVFRVVTYGNDEHFALSIFNRWGQRIYYSGNQREGWDGKVNGRDADAGTYFFTLRAKCLTGQEEFKKGDFVLIR